MINGEHQMGTVKVVRNVSVSGYMAKDWCLYDMDKSEAVASALNNSFSQIASKSDRDETKDQMLKMMESYAKWGAADSEPRWFLNYLLGRVFGSYSKNA
jgi:hypothetical protein